MNAWRRPPPPDKQCRATTKGTKQRWRGDGTAPHRCRRYAVANGYCSFHQPPEHPAEDDPRQERGRDASD